MKAVNALVRSYFGNSLNSAFNRVYWMKLDTRSQIIIRIIIIIPIIDESQLGKPSREKSAVFLNIVQKAFDPRGERILFFWPNTNTNNIRHQNFDRIRIIFIFSEWANTNTNNIRAKIFGRIRIRIIFGFRIVPEYEYETTL